MHKMQKRLLPASGVLTRPAALPDVSGHLPAVFYISCEYFDNSIKALKGIQDASKRKITAIFQLAKPSHSLGRKYVAYLDLGNGMTEAAMERWASTGTVPEVISLLGESPYFADADLSKFGYGSKYVAFNLGDEVLCMSKPSAPAALQTPQDIFEMRLDRARSDAADPQNGDAFRQPFCRRPPHTDPDWRQDWEKFSDGLKNLLELVEDEPHFTLFVISSLNQQHVNEMTKRPFPVLCRSLRGMYPYYTSRGGAGQEPRYNFMHPTGYADGPVSIEIRAAGFRPTASAPVQTTVQNHKLEALPWKSWPSNPAEDESTEFETGIDALARHTKHSSFPNGLPGSPEVQGSKFVIGAVIPGSNNQATKEDVFVVIYLHYLPIKDGRETRKDLQLQGDVRWFMFWKGRSVVMADGTAILPFMKETPSRDASQKAFWKHAKDQVVGQIFFAATTRVDTYKLKFNQAINEQIEKMPDEYYHLDEKLMWQNGETLSASEVRRGIPGVTRIRAGDMAGRYRNWVQHCIDRFDEQWERLNVTSQPTDAVITFEKLKRLGVGSVAYTKGSHVIIDHVGKMLSVYKDSLGKLEQKQTMLGAVHEFSMPRGGSFTDAVVKVSREPDDVFGHQTFKFGIHKLSLASQKQYDEMTKRAWEAVPNHFAVSNAGGSDDAASVRPRPVAPGSVVRATANSPLKQTTVRLCVRNAKRAITREVTHWTQSGPGEQHGSVGLIAVDEIMKDAAGAEVLKTKAELGEVGEGAQAFIFEEDRKRVLPKPGDYTCHYSATMQNKGGQKYWRTIKSPVFRYTAVCGAPVACELHGWPQKVQLDALPHALLLQLTDRYGNSTRAVVTPTVNLSSEQLDIRCEVGQWTQAADGAHQLQLSAIQIAPLPAFHLPGADQPMTCDVKLSVTPDRGLCLSNDYKIDIFAGPPVQLEAAFAQPCFSMANEVPTQAVQNRAEGPEISLRLLDADALHTVPSRNADRVVVKLCPAIPGGSIEHGEAIFDSSSHLAVLSKLRICLPRMKSARTVILQASVPGSDPRIQPMSFTARVVPSTSPYGLLLFADEACTEAMPTEGSASNFQHILKQSAGEKVAPFFFQLEDEAGELKQAPSPCSVKLGNKAAGVHVSESGLVTEVVAPNDLKAPASIEEIKEVPVRVSQGGTEMCKAVIRVVPVAGTAEQWAWKPLPIRSSSQQQSSLQLKNGEDISKLLPPCYLRDRRDNPHDALPHGFDLTTSPQLQVLPLENQEPTQGAPCFTQAGAIAANVVTGLWSFEAPTRLLVMAEVGIVGMPGPVALTLSGGVNSEGTPIQAATLYAQLTVGDMAKNKLGVVHWPSGPVSLRYQVHNLMVTFQDVGGNSLPVPAGSFFVLIDALPGSIATVTASQGGAKQLPVSKASGQLKVAPFSIVSAAAGVQHMRLAVCKNKQNPVHVAAWDLPALTMTPSDLVVSSIEVEAPASVTAGNVLPSISLKLRMEDGSVPGVTGYYNNITVTCTNTPGQRVTMCCKPEGTRVVCEPPEPHRCEAVTTYKVEVKYQPPVTLSSQGAPVTAEAAIAVISGPAHSPSLPAHAVTGRSCFNVGSVAQRTITPSALLTLVDRYGNPALLAGREAADVVCGVSAVSKCKDGDAQCPQLDPRSSHILSMPAADSSMSLGPVLVAEGCAASNAPYHLTIRVAGVPEPLTVLFTFTDASGWTQEKSAAEQRRNEAQRFVNGLTAAMGQKRGNIQTAQESVDQALQAVQGLLGHAVSIENWAHAKDRCQAEWDRLHQLPASRPLHLACPKLLDWQRVELDRVPGVIGFTYELLYVADDDQARLLSWFAGNKLEDLFVTTPGTKNAVKQLWARWGFMNSKSLNIVYLSSSSGPSALPHTGLGLGEVPGNPTFFASMVQFVARGRAQLSHQQQQHIINWVCQGAILMDTEAAADQYREAMIRVTAHCPHLVCNDTGSLIRSGGSTRIGRGATAPRGISGMSLCLGAPPMHVTGGYRRCKSVLTTLASMEHLLERLSKAQAAANDTQGSLDSALAELTDAERALAAVNQQVETLQATGAAAVTRTVTTNARSDAQGGTKRAATNRDSNNFISPNAQKKKPRRSPALLPKSILQQHK